jgi:hypothetical protein
LFKKILFPAIPISICFILLAKRILHASSSFLIPKEVAIELLSPMGIIEKRKSFLKKY